MSDPLARVSRGDPMRIQADTWNAVLDAARAARGRRLGGQGAAGTKPDPFKGCLEIDVRNDTGADLAEYSVLKLSDPLYDVTATPIEQQDRPAFKGNTPGGAADLVCVTQHGIAYNDSGRATVAGVCVCKVSVTNAAHGFALPTASTSYLVSAAATGHPILWKESGTGAKQAVILMAQPVLFSLGSTVMVRIITPINVDAAGLVLVMVMKYDAATKNYVDDYLARARLK